MKYKVGDTVRLKKGLMVQGGYGGHVFTEKMKELEGKALTIKSIKEFYGGYEVEEDGLGFIFTDEMLERVSMPQHSKILAGYVLDLGENGLAKVDYNHRDHLCVSGEDAWFDLQFLGKDLTFGEIKVKAIYGRAENKKAHLLSTAGRDLLWKREEVDRFKIGDTVKVVGLTGRETQTSVFTVGYVGKITSFSFDDKRIVKLDDKIKGYVDVADLEKVVELE